jgi:hypothetical protein
MNQISGDFMLWQKGWWDTRWAFLVLLIVMVAMVTAILPWSPVNPAKWSAEVIQRDSLMSGQDSQSFAALLNNHYGYMWAVFFRVLLLWFWPFFNIMVVSTLYTTSNPMANFGAGLYTHTLPVSRRKVLLTHSGILAIGMTAIAIILAIALGLTLHMMGVWAPFHKILIHALLMTSGGMVFLALSMLIGVILLSILGGISIT